MYATGSVRGVLAPLIVASLVLASATAPLAKSSLQRNEVIAFQEESIPAADLPSPTVTATPTGGAASSPGAESSVTAGQPGPSGNASPANEGSPGAEGSPVAQASPSAAPTEVPPAMDIGSVAPTLQVSDAPLNALIANAPDPARGASLRATEQARKELVAGKVDAAIRDLGMAVSIDASNGYAYLYLGRAYIAKKNYAQAETFLRRAEVSFGADPSWHGEALAFEGVAYEEAGQDAQAASAYQKALAVNPGNLTARVGATRLADFMPPTAPSAAAPPPDGSGIAPPPASAPVPETPPEAEPPPPPPPGPPPEAAPTN